MFLHKLQRAHDRCYYRAGAEFLKEFKWYAEQVAKAYNLNTDCLN
jgi:hypothetical protein